MTTADETATVPTTSANARTLLEIAITERMNAIHAQEEEQRRVQEAQDAEDRKQQQEWLERQLPADVRETLGIALDLKRRPNDGAAATFTFDGQLWHLYQWRGNLIQIVAPDGVRHYSYRTEDGLKELLVALGAWREREVERCKQAEQAQQEPVASKAPRVIHNQQYFCATLSETLADYGGDLVSITALFGRCEITLSRTSTAESFTDDGAPVRTQRWFTLSDDDLDMLIMAREMYRAHLAEANKRQVDTSDDIPF